MKSVINSGKTLLNSLVNALAFANAGNFSEFQTLLNATGETPRTDAQTKPAATGERSAIVTPIRRIHSAL